MKRTEQIAIRITPDSKRALEKLPKKRFFYAQTANRILKRSAEVQKETELYIADNTQYSKG